MRAAIYARVSTFGQEPENQLQELRRYVEARGWTAQEYVDHGVSGSRDSRPALDDLVRNARRRRFDVLVVFRLDRLGRNLKHLVTLLDDLQAMNVGFTSLGEGIDTQTSSGRLQLHILAALAQWERERIRERVLAGLARVRASGKRLGRPRRDVPAARVEAVQHASIAEAARLLGVSTATVKRWRRAVAQKTRAAEGALSPDLARAPSAR